MSKFLLCSDNLLDKDSYKNKFLFIHIPKTAGTVVRDFSRLKRHASGPFVDERQRLLGADKVSEHDSQKYDLNRWIWSQSKWRWIEAESSYSDNSYRWQSQEGQSLRAVGLHYHHLPAFLQKKILSETWNKCFKFCFVRNPWDWMVSWYHFHIQNQNITRTSPHIRALRKYLLSYKDFKSMVKGKTFCEPPDLVKWIMDDKGKNLLDYIGKLENIQEDFDNICDVVGIKKRKLPTGTMASKHGNYKDYYDEESKKIIAKRFEKTIDLFGYTF